MSSVNSVRSVAVTQNVAPSPEQAKVVEAVVLWQKQPHGDMTASVKAAARAIAQAVHRNKPYVTLDPAVMGTSGFDAVRTAMGAARINLGERLNASVAAQSIHGVDDARAMNPAAVNEVVSWGLSAKGTELEPLVNAACKQIISGIAQGSTEIELQCDRSVLERMPVLELLDVKLNWKFVGELQAPDAGNYDGPGSIILRDGGERASWLHSAKEEALAGFPGANAISGVGHDELDSKHGDPQPVAPATVSTVKLSSGMTAHIANVREFKSVATNLMELGLNDGTGFEHFRAATVAAHRSISANLPLGDQAGAHKNLNTETEKVAGKFGELGNKTMQGLIMDLVSMYSPPQG